jgi:hypothetical protein
VQEETLEKEIQNPRNLWLRRPLDDTSLESAAFDIMQLKTLHQFYLGAIPDYPHLEVESKRYVELYSTQLPQPFSRFFNPELLPQEILERSQEVKDRNDQLGTRVCAGCRRALHQDSFRESFAEEWPLRLGEHGRLCHSCRRASRSRDSPSPPRRRSSVKMPEPRHGTSR